MSIMTSNRGSKAETIRLYVLHVNMGVDDDRAYYPQFRKAEARLTAVFGDVVEYELVNSSKPGCLPDDSDVNVLIIPERPDEIAVKFGHMWQETHPNCLVMFL